MKTKFQNCLNQKVLKKICQQTNQYSENFLILFQRGKIRNLETKALTKHRKEK